MKLNRGDRGEGKRNVSFAVSRAASAAFFRLDEQIQMPRARPRKQEINGGHALLRCLKASPSSPGKKRGARPGKSMADTRPEGA